MNVNYVGTVSIGVYAGSEFKKQWADVLLRVMPHDMIEEFLRTSDDAGGPDSLAVEMKSNYEFFKEIFDEVFPLLKFFGSRPPFVPGFAIDKQYFIVVRGSYVESEYLVESPSYEPSDEEWVSLRRVSEMFGVTYLPERILALRVS